MSATSDPNPQGTSPYYDDLLYSYDLPPGGHWSIRVKRGTVLRLTDLSGGANIGMLFYNPNDLLERYNAPDTLKCQHTFKLTAGHCLYSDMGRIFCSIVEDASGWHDTVCGNSTAAMIAQRWQARDYQTQRNDWLQNGEDAFLTELVKYGLGPRDMAANLNLFSRVEVDDSGNLALNPQTTPGTQIALRFEMDTLVVMHNCPHPLNEAKEYPRHPVRCELLRALPLRPDDPCVTACAENQRGFENNRLYHFSAEEA